MTPTKQIRRECDARQAAVRQEHVGRFGAEPYYGIGTGPCRYPECSCERVEEGG